MCIDEISQDPRFLAVWSFRNELLMKPKNFKECLAHDTPLFLVNCFMAQLSAWRLLKEICINCN